MFKPIEFPSGPATLRGRFYSHGPGLRPTVVMAHGTSATITMAIDAYAEAFHTAGYDVLLYDHAGFGISGGIPRQEINPWVQARGIRDAVAFLRAQDESREVILWGDSYSGMIVLVAGALIPDVAAIIAQIPACGPALPDCAASDDALAALGRILAEGDVSGSEAERVGPLPVVSADQINAPSLLQPIQAFRWFIEYGGRPGSRWQNQATRMIPATEVPFHPILTAPYLTMPTLVMVGQDDEMVHCNPAIQRAVYDALAGPRDWMDIPGGHFGLIWHPGPIFDQAVAGQLAFLRGHVAP